eukprot:6188926-Pleurochrysis_carterae.AAC.5
MPVIVRDTGIAIYFEISQVRPSPGCNQFQVDDRHQAAMLAAGATVRDYSFKQGFVPGFALVIATSDKFLRCTFTREPCRQQNDHFDEP